MPEIFWNFTERLRLPRYLDTQVDSVVMTAFGCQRDVITVSAASKLMKAQVNEMSLQQQHRGL